MERIRKFFNPDSVALVGATEKDGAPGRIILENLLLPECTCRVYAVNPNRETILDLKCYPKVSCLPEIPDLVVIVTPAKTVSEIVQDCGEFGVKSIVIISAGFKEIGEEGKKREDEIINIARKYDIRVMGPNCMGIIRPSAHMNGTFARKIPVAGKVAFLSQSGALGAGVLDWAASKKVGFSAFVSLGSMLDVDFGDLIDYFGQDPETRSILIYLESIGNVRKFIGAARGFARSKPIIVIKPGRSQESVAAAKTHTGAIVGRDLYYEAVFRRAGIVRVEKIEDLFDCASILSSARLPKGPNLAIITNAGGPAVLTIDALIDRGGKLAPLGKDTIAALDKFLPPSWSKSNPVDILGDADNQRYGKAIETVVKDPGVNGILVIYTPQGKANPVELAKTIAKHAKREGKPILTALIGEEEVSQARRLLYKNQIPTYEFPEQATRTYLYMYQYARNLEMLYETPVELSLHSEAACNHLKLLIHKALREGRAFLSEEESKKFLSTYGITTTVPCTAGNAADAVRLASRIGYPVVMKIVSPDISHKSDVGGVTLNISSDKEVEEAFTEMMERVDKGSLNARLDGVSIQKMVSDLDYELIIGSKNDPTFGPVIMFGRGGVEAEYFKDIAVGLPPLNQVLARRVLEQTDIYAMLSKGFRNKPPINLQLLDEAMVKISKMVIDFPEIREIDINPLSVKDGRVIALDARIVVGESMAAEKEFCECSHLIICPYPTKYVRPWTCKDGRSVLLRPIRPEDESLEKGLIENLCPEAMKYRFFYIINNLTHDMLTRFCNIDYDREMAIMAEYTVGGERRSVGVSRLLAQPDGKTAEFAVLVADDFVGNGLGLKLTDMLIGIAKEKGVQSIYGIVLNANLRMVNLAQRLGFSVERFSPEEYKVTLEI